MGTGGATMVGLIYAGGTIGKSEGMMLTYDNMVFDGYCGRWRRRPVSESPKATVPRGGASGYASGEPRFHVRGGTKLASAGRPTAWRARVQDEEDCEMPSGAIDQICARGHNVMQGNWGWDNSAPMTVRDCWLRTRDLGYRCC